MTPHYTDATTTVYAGDCLDVLATLPDASVDAVVTDPPYGLEFMGKEWDQFKPASSRGAGAQFANGTVGGYVGKPMPRHGKRWTQRRCLDCGHVDGGASPCRCDSPTWETTTEPGPPRFASTFQAWCELWAAECLRVLKPGGHLLAFGGTRTWHRLACAVEDAGFEVRDSIAWLYGSGFPKSLDVSKAIDKAAGAEREVVIVGSDGAIRKPRAMAPGGALREAVQTLSEPATDVAREWQGWGTALKPAFEPIVVARKPLVGTVAATVLAHGTGALNVDGCRVAAPDAPPVAVIAPNAGSRYVGTLNGGKVSAAEPRATSATSAGRWPANVVLDESQAEALDEMSGVLPTQKTRSDPNKAYGHDHIFAHGNNRHGVEYLGDTGGASRFFYTAKADASERVRVDGIAHPTVKPIALMRWLVRLVTPPGGTVLEPFAGSGTTVEACILEGFRCIAIEREADYLPLIVQRINRRRDPVEAVKGAGVDGGLFDLLDGGAA